MRVQSKKYKGEEKYSRSNSLPGECMLALKVIERAKMDGEAAWFASEAYQFWVDVAAAFLPEAEGLRRLRI